MVDCIFRLAFVYGWKIDSKAKQITIHRSSVGVLNRYGKHFEINFDFPFEYGETDPWKQIERNGNSTRSLGWTTRKIVEYCLCVCVESSVFAVFYR